MFCKHIIITGIGSEFSSRTHAVEQHLMIYASHKRNRHLAYDKFTLTVKEFRFYLNIHLLPSAYLFLNSNTCINLLQMLLTLNYSDSFHFLRRSL